MIDQTFKFIRVAFGYNVVIAVSPADSTSKTEGSKFYRYDADEGFGEVDAPKDLFTEIPKREALSYFSGHADGLGWEELPNNTFTSIQEMIDFVNEKRGYNKTSQTDLINIEVESIILRENFWWHKMALSDEYHTVVVGGRFFGFLTVVDVEVTTVLQIETLEPRIDSPIRIILEKFILEFPSTKNDDIVNLLDYIKMKNNQLSYSKLQELLKTL